MLLADNIARREERGRRLATAMKSSLNLKTQTALAKKAGVGQRTVGRILRGEVDPRCSTLLDICRALRVSVDVLFITTPLISSTTVKEEPKPSA